MDGVFEQTIRCKVLSKDALRQLLGGQLSTPEVVVYARVAVDRLVLAPMDGEIRLPVAVQIKLAQNDAACDRLFVDGGDYFSSPPPHFAG